MMFFSLCTMLRIPTPDSDSSSFEKPTPTTDSNSSSFKKPTPTTDSNSSSFKKPTLTTDFFFSHFPGWDRGQACDQPAFLRSLLDVCRLQCHATAFLQGLQLGRVWVFSVLPIFLGQGEWFYLFLLVFIDPSYCPISLND